MKTMARIHILCALILLLGLGHAGAVGYDKHVVRESAAPQADTKASCAPAKSEAPKPKTWLERGPGLLDDAAAFVKDILGQFGIVEKTAP
jgi:hypothetical protein